MARRGTAARGWFVPAALLVVLAGVAAGLLLERGAFRGAVDAPPPTVVSPRSPPVAPTPPQPAIVSADDPILAAAVRTALGQIGDVTEDIRTTESAEVGDVILRWQLHRLSVRTRRTPEEALRTLAPEVARAGGQVFSHGGILTIGVVRRGAQVTTHEVRFVRVAPAARVAIIFDDAGGSLEDIEAIIALRRPVTVAVLPGLRFSRDVAERTHLAGLEVFLHLPLEPEDATKVLGPGGVTGGMSDAEIAATVRDGLASVPGAVGVNNHMGSKGTADQRVMRAVLGVVKEEGLIWVDSVTSRRTVGGRLAADLGIRSAARNVFLDNADEDEAIRTQIRRLIEVARGQGTAVAIGHAHRRTAQVLGEMLGEFDRAGIELVPASALAH